MNRRRKLAAAAATACVALAAALGLRTVKRDANDYRADVVRAALSQLGQSNLSLYFEGAAPQFLGSRPSWCGIFALWALREAGLTNWVWETGRGFLYRLPRTSEPQAGDIAYYTTNQHQAVVLRNRGDTVDVINGNGLGGVVTLSSPAKSKAAAYYSIQPLIDAKVSA